MARSIIAACIIDLAVGRSPTNSAAPRSPHQFFTKARYDPHTSESAPPRACWTGRHTAMEQEILPPGPIGLPYFRNTLDFIRDPLRFLEETQRTYGDLATLRFTGKRRVILCFHPRHVRYFLVENAAGVTPVGLAPNLRKTL